MNSSSNLSDEFTQVEDWLSEAGVNFTVVDACPHPACEVCVPPMSAAA